MRSSCESADLSRKQLPAPALSREKKRRERARSRALSDSVRRDHGLSLLSSWKRTRFRAARPQMITSCDLASPDGATGIDVEGGPAASAKNRGEGGLHFAGLKGLSEQRGAPEFERYDRGIARPCKEDERNTPGRKN